MSKFAAVTGLVLGFLMMPAAASAAPIGTNGCSIGATGYDCDIFVDYDTGLSTLDATGLLSSWLVGYTFLLNVGADLSDGIQATDVANALVFHSNAIELFTPIVGSSTFSSILAAALALTPIDSTLLSEGQIVGFPTAGGVTQLSGVGLFNTAESVAMLSQIAWGTPGNIGGYDSLTVHTTLPVETNPSPVPEPSTLSVFAIGVGVASAVRRRSVKKIVA